MDAYQAMAFARESHKDQRRKYTGNPYADHLAEVAGIALTCCPENLRPDVMAQVAWLHDCVEDQGVTVEVLAEKFGATVAVAVQYLSDTETGNREERKAASRERLAGAWHWVQTIKVADLISNTASIVQHDPKFYSTGNVSEPLPAAQSARAHRCDPCAAAACRKESCARACPF